MADWENHLSTIFPEVRLKRYLEMRGADVGPPERIVAMSALMIGLYYDSDRAHPRLRISSAAGAPRTGRGCATRCRASGSAIKVRGRDLRSVALDMLAIARGGLERRARRNDKGEDETIWLRPLEAIAESGRSPAHEWIECYEGPWGRRVDPAFAEAAF